jgi:uncharacterized DUF497 family protein
MDFEWDLKKTAQNIRKQGVQFVDAVSVLEDDHALTISEQAADREERFVTLGADAFGRLLVVANTWRRNRVHLISARKATPNERQRYAQGR